MAKWINRIASLAVLIMYILVAAFSGVGAGTLHMALVLALPVLLIWYGDEIGDLLIHWNVQVTATSPGCLIKALAWLILLAPVIISLVYWIWDIE